VKDISEGVGGNKLIENGAQVILIFPLPSPAENHCPKKGILS